MGCVARRVSVPSVLFFVGLFFSLRDLLLRRNTNVVLRRRVLRLSLF